MANDRGRRRVGGSFFPALRPFLALRFLRRAFADRGGESRAVSLYPRTISMITMKTVICKDCKSRSLTSFALIVPNYRRTLNCHFACLCLSPWTLLAVLPSLLTYILPAPVFLPVDRPADSLDYVTNYLRSTSITLQSTLPL